MALGGGVKVATQKTVYVPQRTMKAIELIAEDTKDSINGAIVKILNSNADIKKKLQQIP